jgi:mRNA-degrading endonuclease toxin of MazEF toxin-antitoxin module
VGKLSSTCWETAGSSAQSKLGLWLLGKVIDAEVTTTVRSIAFEVQVGKREGLPRACVVNCDNWRTVAKALLVERIGSVSYKRQTEVKRAVGYALGWNELIDAGQV